MTPSCEQKGGERFGYHNLTSVQEEGWEGVCCPCQGVLTEVGPFRSLSLHVLTFPTGVVWTSPWHSTEKHGRTFQITQSSRIGECCVKSIVRFGTLTKKT